MDERQMKSSLSTEDRMWNILSLSKSVHVKCTPCQGHIFASMDDESETSKEATSMLV